jgi:thiol-disulfide isomerase/thioredoxin
MKILHIDPKTKNSKLFNEYVEKGKHIFVIFYLEGCGPCNATRPEWKKLESALKDKYGKNENIVIADVDQELLKEIKYLTTQPKGFPTIRYISNKGEFSEDYEDSPDIKDKDRKIDSFVKWIDSKMSKQKGGKSKRNKKGGKSKRNKKSRKSVKCGKRNRKTRRNRK